MMLVACLVVGLVSSFQRAAPPFQRAAPPFQRAAPPPRASTRARMGFFDDIASSVKSGLAEATKEASVQHVLVGSRTTALKLEGALREEGVTPESVGRAAQQYSTCGSAKKTPDARMKMLRGRPGELVFRRGGVAKEFEEAAMTGPIGELQVVETQFGVHLLLVNGRSGEAAPEAAPEAGPAPPAEKTTTQKKKGGKKGFG